MRIAYFSPLRPTRSGIADYSEALLPHLARHCQLEVFIEDYTPASQDLQKLVRIRHWREFEEEHAHGRYDAVLYQVGNNPLHVYIYDLAVRVPGMVVLHEFNLHYLLADVTITRSDGDGYLRELEYNAGPGALDHARRVLRGEIEPEYDRIAMNRRLLENSQAAIVHSQYMVGLVRLQRSLEEEVRQEVRLVRQRLRSLTGPEATTSASTEGVGAPPVPAFDYPYFEGRFRGSEQEVRERQNYYVEFFRQRGPVLDLACGRGEFLKLLLDNGITGRGVDRDADMAARCREQGLEVACGDAFTFLEATPDGSLGGIFSAQFIEHLPTAAYVRLVEMAYRKLRSGGALVLETQNPECLAIYSQSFFVDPTHVRPVPAAQLRFWMGEAGFGELHTHYVSPVAPQLPQLPLLKPAVGNADVERWNREAQRFNQTYFGYQDYAVVGIKP